MGDTFCGVTVAFAEGIVGSCVDYATSLVDVVSTTNGACRAVIWNFVIVVMGLTACPKSGSVGEKSPHTNHPVRVARFWYASLFSIAV